MGNLINRAWTIELGSVLVLLLGCSSSGGDATQPASPAGAGATGSAIAGAAGAGFLGSKYTAGQHSGNAGAGRGGYGSSGTDVRDDINRAATGGVALGVGGAETPASYSGQGAVSPNAASGAAAMPAALAGGSAGSGGAATTPIATAGTTARDGAGGRLSNCIVNGIGYPANTVHPSDPCKTCQPSVSFTDWSPRAEGERCGPQSYCRAGVCTVGCVIASQFYPHGTVNPGNECETCDTSFSLNTWSMVPARICGQTLVAGDRHTCALIDGGVWCWGSNERQQLGAGTSDSYSSRPLRVVGLDKGVAAIAAGGDRTCALVQGTTLCWGSVGMAVTGTIQNPVSPTPAQVPQLTTGVIPRVRPLVVVTGVAVGHGEPRISGFHGSCPRASREMVVIGVTRQAS